ncbi:hypothetical protein [Bradyrhizobium sp. BWA-3-5]|uniref:hypothetical protein n=1 Tax=Bradyrhizobium sp. BWA-3-5 TaxID=3080013 RepID=UPI00293EFB51|nr:hypothetical protein [Bradyrhizobium sp. BWA-3-5]WOH63851.1 hypothetical protein RX331_24580 [Bradyrhizobium sp. BWA-3-5]
MAAVFRDLLHAPYLVLAIIRIRLEGAASYLRIIGLTLGFLGMLAIVQPSVSNMTVWIVVGLVGAALASASAMMVKRIFGAETPER